VGERSGRALPIVEATPLTLDAVLRALAAEPDLSARQADGRAFIRALHDGRASAEALLTGWIRPATPDNRKVDSHAPAS
jgi:hypothetical protein